MIGRVAWVGSLIALALLVTFLQLDRQSAANPALAAMVPEPLRGYAQTSIAGRAVEGDDPALALAEARRLVRRRPIPSEHLTLLAIAQSEAGAAEQASVTIQIAGQRGWRDPLAQEAVLRLALAAGDKPEAARRFAALFLRASTSDELLRELAPGVLGDAEGAGRRTLVDIISATDRWNGTFLRRGVQVMPPATFAEIAAASMERGARFDCNALAQVLKGLKQSDATAATRLQAAARGQCPQADT
jgi:hypothetical protein